MPNNFHGVVPVTPPKKQFKKGSQEDEKEQFVVQKVLALWDKWNKFIKEKPKKNPFTAEDFNLTEEEFSLLPHNWFKGFYLTLRTSVGQHLNINLTPFRNESNLNLVDKIMKAPLSRKNPPHKIPGIGWMGGVNRRSKRSKARTYKNRR